MRAQPICVPETDFTTNPPPMMLLSLVMFAVYAYKTHGLNVGCYRTRSVVLSRHITRFSSLSDDMMQSILYRIRACNYMPPTVKHNLMDFVVDNRILGKVTRSMAHMLCSVIPPGRTKPIFILTPSTESVSHMTLSNEEAGSSSESRTDAVMEVMSFLRTQGVIQGWRDELYPLSDGYYNEPLLLVERAAAPFLGTQQYGVHINGLTKVATNQGTNKEELKMWMARRSRTKSKYPSYLDHIVAGGQPAGLGLMENVLKECMEEAGISKDTTLQGIKSSGAVSYETFEPSGRTKDSSFHYDGVVSRAVLFCYDLELPKDFIPTVVDGEVEEFFTWTTDQLLLSTKENYHDPIKPNCYLVIIDYLLRQGVISPESRGYLDIVRELRGGLCA